MPNENPKNLRTIEQSNFRWTELHSANNASTEVVNVPSGVVLRVTEYGYESDEPPPALSLLFVPDTVLVERFTEEVLPADEVEGREEETVRVRHLALASGDGRLVNGWQLVIPPGRGQ